MRRKNSVEQALNSGVADLDLGDNLTAKVPLDHPPAITVDTSVGTRVYVGDTMIHGDTGLRRVDTVNGQGFGYIRRIGNQVTVYFRDVIAPSGEIYVLPTGFRPDVVPQYGLLGRNWRGDLATFTITGGGSLTQGTSHDSDLYFSFTFNTDNDWPTTLPGTPT